MTVAVKESLLEAATEAEGGETETETDVSGDRVINADAIFKLFETDLAVRVTVGGVGRAGGAV